MSFSTLPSNQQIEVRLARFEAEHAVRACMHRYMVLCDTLNAASPLDELSKLFTRNAIWEGIGEKYRVSFGRMEGRKAIREMFAKYMTEPPHFLINVHFLTSEFINVTGMRTATGSWVMLQASTFATGGSHLNAARLRVNFQRSKSGIWRIAYFCTENLFSRPVDAWNKDDLLPVPK
ncbi:nuclear transport factor 2 family protein [Tepidiphilus sp. HLB4]